MTKLLILDKDGTLVRPKSGGTFPQHPEDQELLPGVAKAIARYADAGWKMAIASNQGGCMVRECAAKNFPVGAYLVRTDDQPQAKRIIDKEQEGKIVKLQSDSPYVPKAGYYNEDTIVRFQYKTLDDAIAEMRFCLELLSPQEFSSVLFCPDDGRTCRNQYGVSYSGGGYRKPDKGMIDLAIFQAETGFLDKDRKVINSSDCLFVGDRPEDQQAAANAGIPFKWAHDWVDSNSV